MAKETKQKEEKRPNFKAFARTANLVVAGATQDKRLYGAALKPSIDYFRETGDIDAAEALAHATQSGVEKYLQATMGAYQGATNGLATKDYLAHLKELGFEVPAGYQNLVSDDTNVGKLYAQLKVRDAKRELAIAEAELAGKDAPEFGPEKLDDQVALLQLAQTGAFAQVRKNLEVIVASETAKATTSQIKGLLTRYQPKEQA